MCTKYKHLMKDVENTKRFLERSIRALQSNLENVSSMQLNVEFDLSLLSHPLFG